MAMGGGSSTWSPCRHNSDLNVQVQGREEEVRPNYALNETRNGVPGACRTSFRPMRAMSLRAGLPECWPS